MQTYHKQANKLIIIQQTRYDQTYNIQTSKQTIKHSTNKKQMIKHTTTNQAYFKEINKQPDKQQTYTQPTKHTTKKQVIIQANNKGTSTQLMTKNKQARSTTRDVTER